MRSTTNCLFSALRVGATEVGRKKSLEHRWAYIGLHKEARNGELYLWGNAHLLLWNSHSADDYAGRQPGMNDFRKLLHLSNERVMRSCGLLKDSSVLKRSAHSPSDLLGALHMMQQTQPEV